MWPLEPANAPSTIRLLIQATRFTAWTAWPCCRWGQQQECPSNRTRLKSAATGGATAGRTPHSNCCVLTPSLAICSALSQPLECCA
eukprot:1161171-Pelagomonas_calceolata.AAC.13